MAGPVTLENIGNTVRVYPQPGSYIVAGGVRYDLVQFHFHHPNAVLSALWPHLPKTPGASEKITESVNPGGLLPEDRGYWTYMGSLTAPPCTEGVRWFIFEQEITMSRDQLRAFGLLYKINSRPLQDAHGRRIEANE